MLKIKKFIFTLTIIILIFTCVLTTKAQIYGDGLETENKKMKYNLTIEDKDKELRLDKNIIKNQIEAKLRNNGLKIADEDEILPYSFNVFIHIVGAAYNIKADFSRNVVYTVGDQDYFKHAEVWNRWITGTHAYSEDFIANKVDDLINVFTNHYYRSNDFD